MPQGAYDKEILDALTTEHEDKSIPPVKADDIGRMYNDRVREKANPPSDGWMARLWDYLGLTTPNYALPDRVIDDTPSHPLAVQNNPQNLWYGAPYSLRPSTNVPISDTHPGTPVPTKPYQVQPRVDKPKRT